MLEKKIFDMDVTKELEETFTMTDIKGNEVVILRRIPYDDKLNYVRELAERVLVADEETGLCYESSMYDLVNNYLFVKYYTNIDVDWVETVDDFKKLYDYCSVSGLADVSVDDASDLGSLWVSYSQSIIDLYNKKNSLETLAKGLLSTDVDTNKEETRQLIEKLIDMKGALMEKEENEKVIQFAKANKKAALPKTGGVKLNLAKKN